MVISSILEDSVTILNTYECLDLSQISNERAQAVLVSTSNSKNVMLASINIMTGDVIVKTATIKVSDNA